MPTPEQIPLISVPASGNNDSNNNTTTTPSSSREPANPYAPEPAHVHHDTTNADLEAGPAVEDEEANAAADAEALPAYKEHDMEEPLPPYMARVRRVMRGEEPMATIMPSRRTGGFVLAGFVLVVVIIVAVSVGVSVSGNKNSNGNKR